LMNSLCDPSHEAPSPACRGSWTPIARAASDRPSSPARAIVACPPAASDLSSSTADCRRLCVAPLPSTKRDPASLSDRVRWCFGRPSSRAPQPRSHRTPRPSPRPPRSTADPARSERNEGLHTGCGGVIRRSSKRHRRWLPRQESPNQSMLPKSRTRFTCFWGSPNANLASRISDRDRGSRKLPLTSPLSVRPPTPSPPRSRPPGASSRRRRQRGSRRARSDGHLLGTPALRKSSNIASTSARSFGSLLIAVQVARACAAEKVGLSASPARTAERASSNRPVRAWAAVNKVQPLRVQSLFVTWRHGGGQFGVQRVREARDDFILHLEQIGERAIEPL